MKLELLLEMINRFTLKHDEFINESNRLGINNNLKMGSLIRMQGNIIKIIPAKFDESKKIQTTELNVISEDKLFKISFGNKEIKIPKNAFYHSEIDPPEELILLQDSKWLSNEKNENEFYDFLDEYLSKIYTKDKENDQNHLINNIKFILDELNIIIDFKNLQNKENRIISFKDENNRYYKIKNNQKNIIKSIDIFNKRGDKKPIVNILFGWDYKCKIYWEDEIYFFTEDKINNLKNNNIFSFFTSKKRKLNEKEEEKIKLLLLNEIKQNNIKRYSKNPNHLKNNIEFLNKFLSFFSGMDNIKNYIKKIT